MIASSKRGPAALSALVIAIASSYALPARADATPVGPEFQVSQPYYGFATPQVVRNSSGAAVIVWEDAGSSPTQFYARLYNADGTPKGNPIVVLPVTTSIWSANDGPLVAMDDNGNFIVAATNQATVNGNFADYIAVQRYDANGIPQGGLINVAPVQEGGGTIDLHVAMDSDGDFVVGWTDYEETRNWCIGFSYLGMCSVNEGSSTYARVYGKDGTPKTAALVAEQVPFQNIITFNGYQKRYDLLTGLAMNSAGQFAMGFSNTVTPNSFGAAAMLFDANGAPISGKIGLASKAINGADVGLDSQGDLVATWMTGYANNVSTIKLNFAGYSSVGTRLWQHSQAAAWSYNPVVKVELDGDFVLAWLTRLGTGGFQENAQYFRANGSANGSAFSISQDSAADTGSLDAAIDANGNLLATWTRSVPDPTGNATQSVMGRLFNAP